MNLNLKAWGRIGVAAYALGAAKYVTRRFADKRWDDAFRKLHLVAALALPAAAGVHTAQALRCCIRILFSITRPALRSRHRSTAHS